METNNKSLSADISFPEVYSLCSGVNYVLSENKVDYIVGISRGGLIPATIISHMTNTPLVVVDYSSSKGKVRPKSDVEHFPIIEDKKILIVDDIIDSGYTIQDVEKFYTNFGCSTYTFALFYKPNNAAGIKPTMYGFIPKDDEWINFPWEV